MDHQALKPIISKLKGMYPKAKMVKLNPPYRKISIYKNKVYRSWYDYFSNYRLKEECIDTQQLIESRKNIHDKVLKSTSSGGMVINDCVLHHMNPNLPFGGINNSGVGNYHGKFGFDAFSHHKAVLKSSSLSPFKIMLPPYTKTKESLANLIKKYF